MLMSHTHNKQTHILKSTNNSRAQRHKQDPPKRIRWSSNWSNEHVTITRYAINWQNVLVGLTCGYSCCRNRRQPNRPSEISCRLHPRKQNTIYSECYTAQYNDHDDLVSLFSPTTAPHLQLCLRNLGRRAPRMVGALFKLIKAPMLLPESANFRVLSDEISLFSLRFAASVSRYTGTNAWFVHLRDVTLGSIEFGYLIMGKRSFS